MSANRHGMTGFGRSSGSASWGNWSVEAKSVNGRGLDVRVNAPPGFERAEAFIRDQAKARFHRGSLQVAVRVDLKDEAALGINTDALAQLATVWNEALGPAEHRLDGLSMATLMTIRGVVESGSGGAQLKDLLDNEEARNDLSSGISVALDQLRAARAAEGQALHGLLSGLLGEMSTRLQEAAEVASQIPETLKQKLEARVAELVGTSGIEVGRLEAEVVLAAARADVREELDRLAAHINSGHELLNSEGAVGRKLDFLSQELMREANTLCSKSSSMPLTQSGLALKALIDQFKEQAANVE